MQSFLNVTSGTDGCHDFNLFKIFERAINTNLDIEDG